MAITSIMWNALLYLKGCMYWSEDTERRAQRWRNDSLNDWRFYDQRPIFGSMRLGAKSRNRQKQCSDNPVAGMASIYKPCAWNCRRAPILQNYGGGAGGPFTRTRWICLKRTMPAFRNRNALIHWGTKTSHMNVDVTSRREHESHCKCDGARNELRNG